MVYLYLIAKIYKIQFLRVKVTRFFLHDTVFRQGKICPTYFKTQGTYFEICALCFLSAPGARQHAGKEYPFHGMEKPPYLPAFSVRVSAVRAAGRQGRLQKGMPRRGGDFLRRGNGCRILQSRAASIVGYNRVECKVAYVIVAGFTVHVPVDVHVAEHGEHGRGVFGA